MINTIAARVIHVFMFIIAAGVRAFLLAALARRL